MASAPDDEEALFLLNALATSDGFQPNYGQLGTAMGINNAHNAQRKFKSIVEVGKKFKLESGKGKEGGVRVVKLGDGGISDTPPTTPATKTPKSRKRTKKEDEGEDEAEASPTKKSKTKSGKKVEEDVDAEDEDAKDEEDKPSTDGE